jgi:hypothetical protein
MRLFLLSLLSFLTLCCDNKKPTKRKIFNDFDFSYNDVFSTCFSLKLTQGDTVFIRQHFSLEPSDLPKKNKSYFAILDKQEREKADSFIKAIDFNRYDTIYYQDYQDGIEYQFYINNDTTKKTVYVHSGSAPSELFEFSKWIVDTKEHLKYYSIDTTISYGSLKHFLPPAVPPPTRITFKPPEIKNSRQH